MKLYVGNLSYDTTEDTLKTLFSNYADVASVSIAKDRFTQQSKGFGFVEIEDETKAQRAIGGMNGKDVDGRRIRVSEAVEKTRTERRDFDDRNDGYRRSERRDFDSRDSNGGRSGYGRRDESRNYRSDRRDDYGRRDGERPGYRRSYDRRDDERRYGRSDSERRDGGNYGRFSRRDDNPDKY